MLLQYFAWLVYYIGKLTTHIGKKSTAKTGKSNKWFDVDSKVCNRFSDLDIIKINFQKLSLSLHNPRHVQVQIWYNIRNLLPILDLFWWFHNLYGFLHHNTCIHFWLCFFTTFKAFFGYDIYILAKNPAPPGCPRKIKTNPNGYNFFSICLIHLKI